MMMIALLMLMSLRRHSGGLSGPAPQAKNLPSQELTDSEQHDRMSECDNQSKQATINDQTGKAALTHVVRGIGRTQPSSKCPVCVTRNLQDQTAGTLAKAAAQPQTVVLMLSYQPDVYQPQTVVWMPISQLAVGG